jgi:hypothetical protein
MNSAAEVNPLATCRVQGWENKTFQITLSTTMPQRQGQI